MYNNMTRQRKNKTKSSDNTRSTSQEKSSLKHEETIGAESRFHRLFGFEAADLTNWSALVATLNRPADSSSLGIFRIAFGFLMALDIPFERGLSNADYRFGDELECRFPLFDFLQPMPLAWMYVVYLVMFLGAVGIMLGLLFRTSCVLYLCTYWYLLLLDKTVWNNHSYLYGLCAFLLLWSDANRYCSLDGLIAPRIKNTHVPLWNYTLLRTQFFLVYFIAGLKKLDPDWLMGYSMQSLSHHWVFKPFTALLTYEQIDLLVVHHGGLLYDMTNGFLLFFDATRPLGVTLSVMFHSMNAQMFTIGMFPYVMLATMPIFSDVAWPKRVIAQLTPAWQRMLPSTEQAQLSPKCVYNKTGESSMDRETTNKKRPLPSHKSSLRWRHHVAGVCTVCYVAVQGFMPYSHFLTPGYNTWTNGLYGYSWDMMVHTWTTQHIRITYVNQDTGEEGFLKPDAWTRVGWRWSSHSDMVKQYAACIQDRLADHGLTNVGLYFDVWRSLNDRFQQRMFDPRVDILRAPWAPSSPTPWQLPLLTGLTHWRQRLDELEKGIYDSGNDVDVVFMADFPGLTVENFLQSELMNITMTLLDGEVVVEVPGTRVNVTLRANDTVKLASGAYHHVHTVSPTPSCFMYTYVNRTETRLQKELHDYESTLKGGSTQTRSGDKAGVAELYKHVQERRDQLMATANSTTWEKVHKFFTGKVKEVVKSATMTGIALKSLATGKSFEAVFNATVGNGESLMF